MASSKKLNSYVSEAQGGISYTFLVVYAVYLVPIIWSALSSLSGTREDVDMRPIDFTEKPPHFAYILFFFGILLFNYIGLRIFGKYFGIKMHEKSAADHRNDAIWLFVAGAGLTGIGGVDRRLANSDIPGYGSVFQIPFAVTLTFYTAIFTCLFELVRECRVSLSPAVMKQSNYKTVIGIIVSGCLAVFCSAYAHVQITFKATDDGDPYRLRYLLLCGLAFAVHFSLFSSRLMELLFSLDTSHLHLHHWYWPLPLAHMCTFVSDVSLLSQAMFIGMFIHGVACFGSEELFYDTAHHARHPSEYEYRRIERRDS